LEGSTGEACVSDPQNEGEQSGLDRRSLVKKMAIGAFAVPAIVSFQLDSLARAGTFGNKGSSPKHTYPNQSHANQHHPNQSHANQHPPKHEHDDHKHKHKHHKDDPKKHKHEKPPKPPKKHKPKHKKHKKHKQDPEQ